MNTNIRCIGSRTSARTLESLRNLTDKVIGLTKNYRESAVTAIKQGSSCVYVPAGLTEKSIDDFFGRLVEMESYGNTAGEPVYADLPSANVGHNEDGTAHNGFLVVDVIERLVIDLVNRDGTTRLITPLVRFVSSDRVLV